MAGLAEDILGSSDRRVGVGECSAELLKAVGKWTCWSRRRSPVAEAIFMSVADGRIDFGGVVPRDYPHRQRSLVEGQIWGVGSCLRDRCGRRKGSFARVSRDRGRGGGGGLYIFHGVSQLLGAELGSESKDLLKRFLFGSEGAGMAVKIGAKRFILRAI